MTRSTTWLRRPVAASALALILIAGTAAGTEQPGAGAPKAKAAPGVSGPTPALTLADLPTHPVSPTALYLQTGVIDTSAPAQGLEQHCGPQSAGLRFVIQLDGPMTPRRKTLLRDAGVDLGDYLPMNAWIVRLDHADAAKVAGLAFIRWHSDFDANWKLSPDLGRQNFSEPARQQLAKQGLSAIVVTLFDAEPAGAILNDMGKVRASRVLWAEDWDGNMTICMVVPTDEVPFLALRPDVQFVEEAPDIELRNSTVRWIIQTNQVNGHKFWDNGVTGTNQVVGILDGRVDRNHCSFIDSDPIGPLHRKILAYNSTAGAESHGTHVAGTVVGDSGDMSDKRGVAYNGKLVYAGVPAFTEGSILAALNLHHTQTARVHTNSWGDDGTTQYNSLCRGFDMFNWQHEDSLVVLAVSNSSLLKNPENAKNLLAIGNSDDTPNQANHCTGGDGPTSDGRRKPEVYAPGCGTISASAGTPCGTASSTGTSMATPASAGLAMLMRQYFMDGYYPAGVAGSGESITPSAAMLKTLMVNCAVDMTGVSGFPSNREGWGRLLGDNAIPFPGDSRQLVFSDIANAEGFSTGGFTEVTISVVTPNEPFKATLAWTEPPAAAGAGFAAINNLNLTVTSPSGQVYKGNVFQAGASAQGGNYDDRNNVEQVLVNTPTVGAWTVRVDAAAVNTGPQGYAYSVTGDLVTGPVPVSISVSNPPPPLRTPGESYTVNVTIRPGDDAIVGGTPMLHVRRGPDQPFVDTPLTFIEGTSWQGAVNAAQCSDVPQFYVSVEGVTTGLRTSPAGAPTNVFSSDVGTLDTVETLVGDLSAGLPAGWSATGLWNWTSTDCSANGACVDGGWAYYGRTTGCNYDTGAPNEGTLTATSFEVPSGDIVTLSYCSSLLTENNPNYDFAELLVDGEVVDRADDSDDWQTRTVDFSPFAGQVVTLSWRFRTVDGVQNSHRGWQINNVRVTATEQVCVDSCAADWDHNGTVNSTDVSAFINDWFTDVANGTLVTDWDHNGVVNSTDVSAFINAFFEAPPHCTG